MEKECKKCGSTENVNFDGMCKKCYEDSIVIHEKESSEATGNIKKKKSFWSDKKNIAIVVVSFLLFCVLVSSNGTQTDQINELNEQFEKQSAKVESLSNEKKDLLKENNQLKALKTDVETLKKEKEELTAKLNTLPSTEELQKTLDEKNQYILNLESQVGSLTAEKAQIEAQNGILQEQISKAQSSSSKSQSSSSGSSTSSSVAKQSTGGERDSSATVYITDTGSKYHRAGCSYLRSSSHAIGKSSAISQGYGACSRCNP